MSTPITLSDLTSRTRERSNMENSTFVTDSEIKHYLNDEVADIYAKMVNVEKGSLFATVSPVLSSIGNNSFAFPTDFMRLVDVNIYTGSRWVPAYEADVQNYYQLLGREYTGDHDVRYFLHLNATLGRYELFLFPVKDAADIGVRYIPEAPTLSLTTDTLKWPSNWHEPVVLGAAAKCLMKEESEASHLMIEKDQATARVLKDIRTQTVAEIQTLRQLKGRNRRRTSGGQPWG